MEREQRRASVAAAPTQSRAVGNFLVQDNRNAAFCLGSLKKGFGGADDKIFIAVRNRGIIALEIDPAGVFVDLEFVAERDRRNERLNFMKSIFPPAQDL